MRRAKLVVTAAAAVTALLVIGAGAGAANGNGKSALPGSAPGWAKKSNFVGAADPNGAVGFRVYLGWNDLAGAEALAVAPAPRRRPGDPRREPPSRSPPRSVSASLASSRIFRKIPVPDALS